ncbi:MAG: ABC transporter ATP-binding protein [Polyangiaceae bacterium]
MPRTVGLVYRASPKGTFALAGLTIAASLLPLAVAATAKLIVDAVLAKDTSLALKWVLAEAVLVALQAGAMRGLGLVRSVLGARLGLDINVQILEKALTLELSHFEDPEVYDRLTRARREASARPISVVLDTFQIVQNTVTLAGYVALIASYSGLVVLGLVAATIPATIAEVKFGAAAFRLRNWRSPDARKLNYLEYVLANDEYAKEVKVFGFGPLLLDRYRALGETFYREDRDLAVKRSGWAYALSLLATGAFYASYVAMGLAAAAGTITLGQMTLYVLAFRQGQAAFQAILSAVGGMYEDNLYMSNLFDFLALGPPKRAASKDESANAEAPAATDALAAPDANPLVSKAQIDLVPASPDERGATSRTASAPLRTPRSEAPLRLREADSALPVEAGVRFEDVGFRYPGRDTWALRHVSLFLPAGRSVALVGHNGAGKTTFIKLLTRLYEPSEGRILLDGKDLAEWDPEAVRARIGVVFQDFGQYKLLARETVGIGDVARIEDEADIERAVDLGGARDVVDRLPQKLATQLGRWFKGGVDLSGGQWQKLALARAFLRQDADILILDEPTAALDAEAEHAVFERFQRLSQGKTSLVISHRFPTVRLAERIIVLERGGIVEQGTHADLLAAGGLYARLFSIQAQGYL